MIDHVKILSSSSKDNDTGMFFEEINVSFVASI